MLKQSLSFAQYVNEPTPQRFAMQHCLCIHPFGSPAWIASTACIFGRYLELPCSKRGVLGIKAVSAANSFLWMNSLTPGRSTGTLAT
jgi:hypothetical protein